MARPVLVNSEHLQSANINLLLTLGKNDHSAQTILFEERKGCKGGILAVQVDVSQLGRGTVRRTG